MEHFENKSFNRYSPFTLGEYRIFYARALLLKNLFSNTINKKEMERANFYFNDLVIHSLDLAHMAQVSKYYFKAREGKIAETENEIKAAFAEIITLSRVDMVTKLWLFYDAFIYGKTMEMVGNIEEEVKGFKQCIKANPHADLAKISEKILKNLAQNK